MNEQACVRTAVVAFLLVLAAACAEPAEPGAGPGDGASTGRSAPAATPPPRTPETVPDEPSTELAVHVERRALKVGGASVPGRWQLTESRRDVWVAIRTGAQGATSQWWGTGTSARPMPPSVGSILRGGVVISQDARWIVWTRPAADVLAVDPPRVMEVVETATGEVRWSRDADHDAPEIGALAVTNDGTVVFGHCLEPTFDSGGWPQCDDARLDVWSPATDAIRTVPAEVSVHQSPFAGSVTELAPLVRRTGAHNGLLGRSAARGRPQYLRVSDRGQVDVVTTLPRNTVAVTADERFALLREGECPDEVGRCGFHALRLDDGERRLIPSLYDLVAGHAASSHEYVAERDDLLLVRDAWSGAVVARCALSQAQCVPIRK